MFKNRAIFGEKVKKWARRIENRLSCFGTKLVIRNYGKFGRFPAIRSWDQFSRRNKEYSFRNIPFSVQLCAENQCNWANLIAFWTNFVNTFCPTVFTSRSVRNWTLWRDQNVIFVKKCNFGRLAFNCDIGDARSYRWLVCFGSFGAENTVPAGGVSFVVGTISNCLCYAAF